MDYKFQEIEPRWQKYWDEQKTFSAEEDFSKPKFYALGMFPYPSGSGLHVGHPASYVPPDIVARYKKMNGFNVLHPMGWDAFGLPAEQYAIDNNSHPRTTTTANINRFRTQLKSLGLSYDWDREVNTSDPDYFKWTQWIFLKLLEKDLAYVAEVPVNWCPALGTVLANEEVIDGLSERGGHPVVRRPMRQWVLKITAFAERLLDDLDDLDWPHSLKEMQRNWIGRSIGAEVDFVIEGDIGKIRVFTTRPDTLFGATYMVLAPEHPLVDTITTDDQKAAVEDYVKQASYKSDLERTDLAKTKTGVFTGAYAINPVNNQKVPVWIADYVLVSYGTGAIMAVPGHDERDYEFAKTFDLPIVEVIGSSESNLAEEAWTGDGKLVNSDFLNGLDVESAKTKIIDWLEQKAVGVKAINYKLRDWLFSRQRYWGEPFPVIHTKSGEIKALPEEQLPVRLPDVENYKPTGTGESPLAAIKEWVETTDPETGEAAQRETNTMPGWAGSCWYYLRYIDPHNTSALIDPAKEKYWMPVDLYVGGVEHAVLHLLYARFWHKVLYDAGVVTTKEPFQKLVNQGMILGYTYRYFVDEQTGELLTAKDVETKGLEGLQRKDGKGKAVEKTVHWSDVKWQNEKPTTTTDAGETVVLEQVTEKMSKSRGNVVNPDDVVAEFGADTLRLYEMFMGPLQQVKPWDPNGVTGVHRFLQRVWRRFVSENGGLHADIGDGEAAEAEQRLLHKLIKKVTHDTQEMRFNTAIAAMMETLNAFYKLKSLSRSTVEAFVQLLNPYAPHIAEELWQMLGHEGSISFSQWPAYEEALTIDASIKMAVQINGKVRGTIEIAPDCNEEDAVAEAKAQAKVASYLEGKNIVKTIYRVGRILNFVVKG